MNHVGCMRHRRDGLIERVQQRRYAHPPRENHICVSDDGQGAMLSGRCGTTERWSSSPQAWEYIVLPP
jgi:hypothetical protein